MPDLRSKFNEIENQYTENKVNSLIDEIEYEVRKKQYELEEMVNWKNCVENSFIRGEISLVRYISYSCNLNEKDICFSFDSDLFNALEYSERMELIQIILKHFKKYRGYGDFILMNRGVTHISLDSTHLIIEVYSKGHPSVSKSYMSNYLSPVIPCSFNISIMEKKIRGSTYRLRKLDCKIADILRLNPRQKSQLPLKNKRQRDVS